MLPFLFIILLSFRSMADIFRNPLGFTGNWVPENFARAWNGPPGGTGFGHYFVNSLVVAFVAVVLAATDRRPSRPTSSRCCLAAGGRECSMMPLIATIVPTIALLIPFFQVFSAWGMLNNPVGGRGALRRVVPADDGRSSCTRSSSTSRATLREAGAIDGLGHFTHVRRASSFRSRSRRCSAVSLLNLIWVWGETQIAIVLLQRASSQTIPVGVLTFQSSFMSDLGPIFAGLSLATIPVLIVYFTFNKTISQGVSMGGTFR